MHFYGDFRGKRSARYSKGTAIIENGNQPTSPLIEQAICPCRKRWGQRVCQDCKLLCSVPHSPLSRRTPQGVDNLEFQGARFDRFEEDGYDKFLAYHGKQSQTIIKGGEYGMTVKLNPGESQESLLRRFRKEVMKARILPEVRRKRWYTPPSELRRLQKQKAIRKARQAQRRRNRQGGL